MEPGENIVTYQAMVIGFLDATGRFERAIRRREAARAYAGLFEALNWAVALGGRGREH